MFYKVIFKDFKNRNISLNIDKQMIVFAAILSHLDNPKMFCKLIIDLIFTFAGVFFASAIALSPAPTPGAAFE